MSLEVRSVWLRCHVGRGPRQPQALGAVVSEARTLRLDLRSGEHSPSRIRCSRRRRRERAHRREEEVATVDRAPTVLGDLDLLRGRGQAGGARSRPPGQHCPTSPGVLSILGLPGGRAAGPGAGGARPVRSGRSSIQTCQDAPRLAKCPAMSAWRCAPVSKDTTRVGELALAGQAAWSQVRAGGET